MTEEENIMSYQHKSDRDFWLERCAELESNSEYALATREHEHEQRREYDYYTWKF